MSGRLRSHLRSNVVGYIALFCFAIGGTAYATHPGGANTISTDDIINGQVLTQDIGTGNVMNSDIAANSVVSSKLANGTVQGADVANDTLTGADIDEATLAGVSDSRVHSSNRVRLAIGVDASATLLTARGFTLTANCAIDFLGEPGAQAWISLSPGGTSPLAMGGRIGTASVVGSTDFLADTGFTTAPDVAAMSTFSAINPSGPATIQGVAHSVVNTDPDSFGDRACVFAASAITN